MKKIDKIQSLIDKLEVDVMSLGEDVGINEYWRDKLLDLIELVQKKDELIQSTIINNGERFNLEKTPELFFDWSARMQIRLLEVLKLTEEFDEND